MRGDAVPGVERQPVDLGLARLRRGPVEVAGLHHQLGDLDHRRDAGVPGVATIDGRSDIIDMELQIQVEADIASRQTPPQFVAQIVGP